MQKARLRENSLTQCGSGPRPSLPSSCPEPLRCAHGVESVHECCIARTSRHVAKTYRWCIPQKYASESTGEELPTFYLFIPGWGVSLESMFTHFLLLACFVLFCFLFCTVILNHLSKMVLSCLLSYPLCSLWAPVTSSGQHFLPSLPAQVALSLVPLWSCRARVLTSVTSGTYPPGFGLRPQANAPLPQACLAHLSLD